MNNIIFPHKKYTFNRLEIIQGNSGMWRYGYMIKDFGEFTPYIYETRDSAIEAIKTSLQGKDDPLAKMLLLKLDTLLQPVQLNLL